MIGWVHLLLILFLLSLPVLLFFRWVIFQQQHRGVTDREIKQLFVTFLGGAFLIPMLSFLFELALAPFLASLLFFGQSTYIQSILRNSFFTSGDDEASPTHGSESGQIPTRFQSNWTIGHIVLVFVSFVLVAITEECLKYWVVQGTCCRRPSKRESCMRSLCCCGKSKKESVPAFSILKQRQQRHGALRGMMCHPSRLLFYHRPHANHAFVVFLAVVAASLGLSVMENIVSTLYASTFPDQFKNVILRDILQVPFQCLCGGMIGVRMAERLLALRYGGSEETGIHAAKADLKRWRTKVAVVFPAILIHTTFTLQQFLITTLVTDKMETTHWTVYHIVLSIIGSSIILIPTFVYLRRKLHAIENKMNETRYMHVAVDWESGQRREGANSDFGDEMDFFGVKDHDDDHDFEDVNLVRGEPRQ